MNCPLASIGLPFIPSWPELRPFVADLWIIATIVAVLLTPFFTRKSNLACAAVAAAGLLVALVSLILVVMAGDIQTSAGVEPLYGQRFVGMLVLDPFAVMWKVLLLLFVIGIILMWYSTTAPRMHEGDGPEFFALLLGATLGMSLMASTSNLLMILMSVELASLPSYVLAGFRKTHRIGAEASLKYVLFGAATSAIMAYGLSILYGLYGTLQVGEIATQMATGTGGSVLLAVAVFGLIVGIGFKISAVPFHFWCPDVFEGASIEVSAFLSVASKGAALALLLRIVMLLAATLGYQHTTSLTSTAALIGILGAITCTVGNTAAYVQTNIKRLLAYSSIAHAGYMLCALSLLVKSSSAAGSFDPASAAAQAILLYLAVYLFMNLGAFTAAGLIYRQTGSEDIRDYAGLGRRSPLLAACLFCCLVSLIGLPPFAGFAAKLYVLYVLFQNGSWWWTLIIAIGVNTIISAFYYFRIVRAMYLTDSDQPGFIAHPLGTAITVTCAVALVAMLIGFGPLNTLTGRYGKLTMAPAAPPAPATPTVAATP